MRTGNNPYLSWESALMFKILNMPTYNELVGLSDSELIKRVGWALSQVDEAEKRGETLTDKAKIYQIYNNELAKRKYKQRIR